MSFRSPSGRTRSWIFRALRMSVAGTFVLGAFGAVALRVNLARASDLGMSLSEPLLLIGENTASGGLDADVFHVHFNGQTLDSTNILTHLTMREVLEYMDAQCRQDAGGMRDVFQHLEPALGARESTSGVPGSLVVRQEYGDRGYVFCVAPDRALSTVEVLSRLQEAGQSGDFSRVGNLRYVAVKRLGDRTRVVTAWTDHAFEFGKMFPDDSDSPGDDFGGVPRPEGGRRTLSATIEGAPAGVNSYAVHGKADDVLAALDGKLTTAGWKPVALAKGVPNAGKYYTLGSREDLVVTANDGADGVTNVGYVVSRSVASISR